VTVYEGLIRWPFHPFEEVADDMAAAEHGGWVGPLERGLGIYFLRVRGETRRAQPAFEEAREAFEKQERELERMLQRRVRQRAILRECGFFLDTAAVEAFSKRYLAGEASAAEDVLARYALDGQARVISAGDFVTEQRRRLIRIEPRSREDVEAALERMVVEEVNYRAARAAGLDREPKFLEDRRNFELVQVLTRHEEEVLATRAAVSGAELDAAVKARRGEFPAGMPEEQIVKAVQHELRREKLDAVELEDFLRGGGAGRLELRIDFLRYGIRNPFGGTSAASPRRRPSRFVRLRAQSRAGDRYKTQKHKTQTPQKR